MSRRAWRRLGVSLLALPASLLAAPFAAGDSSVDADPTAANVSALGSVAAWSRRAGDGTYRLVLRERGAILDAPIGPSSYPFDPDVGTNEDGSAAIVYSRCAGPGKDSGCDVYRFDVSARTESRLAAVSMAGFSETAPSYDHGMLAFVRSGGVKRRGIYLYRPGARPRRLAPQHATETDLHATQIVFAYRSSGRTYIRTVNRARTKDRILAHGRLESSGSGDVVLSPQITRYNFVWLRATPRSGTAIVQRSGSVSNRSPTPVTADRTLSNVTSLAVDRAPVLYTSGGVQAIQPPLLFSSG